MLRRASFALSIHAHSDSIESSSIKIIILSKIYASLMVQFCSNLAFFFSSNLEHFHSKFCSIIHFSSDLVQHDAHFLLDFDAYLTLFGAHLCSSSNCFSFWWNNRIILYVYCALHIRHIYVDFVFVIVFSVYCCKLNSFHSIMKKSVIENNRPKCSSFLHCNKNEQKDTCNHVYVLIYYCCNKVYACVYVRQIHLIFIILKTF